MLEVFLHFETKPNISQTSTKTSTWMFFFPVRKIILAYIGESLSYSDLLLPGAIKISYSLFKNCFELFFVYVTTFFRVVPVFHSKVK